MIQQTKFSVLPYPPLMKMAIKRKKSRLRKLMRDLEMKLRKHQLRKALAKKPRPNRRRNPNPEMPQPSLTPMERLPPILVVHPVLLLAENNLRSFRHTRN